MELVERHPIPGKWFGELIHQARRAEADELDAQRAELRQLWQLPSIERDWHAGTNGTWNRRGLSRGERRSRGIDTLKEPFARADKRRESAR